MGRLGIDLRDGFKNDTVVITVDGREAYRKGGVSTRFQIGLAEQVKLDVADRLVVAVRIDVPSKSVSTQVEVNGVSPRYVGVSLTAEGAIECRQQDEPFGYL